MKRILRGNDVIINWTVKQLVNDVSTVVDFTGKTIKVFICDSYGTRPVEFSIVDGIISIHLSGSTQNAGTINLDCYWQDITSFVCNRTKLNSVIEFVDNPSLIDLYDKTNDVDILTADFTSDSFFGGTYIANFSNYYTKSEIDARGVGDYNSLINKPFTASNGTLSAKLLTSLEEGLIIGNYVTSKSGSYVSKLGDAEFNTISVRNDLNIKGKLYINGAEVFSGRESVINFTVLDSRYLAKSLWDSVFEVDLDGKLKIKVDAYSIGGLSALGDGTTEVGTGTGLDYEAIKALLTSSLNAYAIDAAFLTNVDTPYLSNKLVNVFSSSDHTHNVSALINDLGFVNAAYVTNAISSVSEVITNKWTTDLAKITNWDNAYSWGNHSLAGYLLASVFNGIFSITEVNGVKTLQIKGNAYVDGDLSALGDATATGGGTGLDYEAIQNLLTGSINAYQINSSFLTAIDTNYIVSKLGDKYSLSTHSHKLSELTNDTGFITNTSLVGYATELFVNNKVQINANAIGELVTTVGTKWTTDNVKIGNWDAAYSWGDHKTAGYLKSASFSDIFEVIVDENGNKTVKINGSLYATSGISALGDGTGSGGGGGSSGILNSYTDWNAVPDPTFLLSSTLAKPLYEQVQQIESDIITIEENLGSKTLGGLSNVSDNADSATEGNVIVKEANEWKVKLYDHIRRAITDINDNIIETRDMYLLRVVGKFRYQGLNVVLKKIEDTIESYVRYEFVDGVEDVNFQEVPKIEIVDNFTDGSIDKAASAGTVKTLYGLVMHINGGTFN